MFKNVSTACADLCRLVFRKALPRAALRWSSFFLLNTMGGPPPGCFSSVNRLNRLRPARQSSNHFEFGRFATVKGVCPCAPTPVRDNLIIVGWKQEQCHLNKLSSILAFVVELCGDSCRKTFLQLTLWQMLRCDEKTCNFAREINVERFGLLATTVKNAKRKILPFMQMHAYPLSDPGF